MRAVYVGIDPGFSNTGIVAIDTDGKVLDAYHIHNTPTHNDKQTYDQWNVICLEVEETLRDFKKDYSPQRMMTIGVLAPITVPGASAGKIKLHVATGIIFAVALEKGSAFLRKDVAVRRALGPVIQCPKEFKKNGKKSDAAKTEFVQQFWLECPNAHLADAWLMARYVLLQRG